MPKRKEPVMNSQIAQDIYNELKLYAKDKQVVPIQNALYSYMTKPQFNPETRKKEAPRYKLSLGTFDYWFERLVDEGYITVDRASRGVRCVELEIVEKPDPVIPDF